jgi:hypothetical protein
VCVYSIYYILHEFSGKDYVFNRVNIPAEDVSIDMKISRKNTLNKRKKEKHY